MDREQLQFVLEELSFSSGLPRQLLQSLADECTLIHMPAGGTIFREGTQVEQLYLIRSGRVALEMNVPGRGAVRILTLGPGEMVGWSALLGQGRMTASAVCLEATELVVAEAKPLRLLCEANSDFGYHLMREMAQAISQRLVATRLQLLDLFADNDSVSQTREP